MSMFPITFAVLSFFVHRIQSGNICSNSSLPYKTEDNNNCANFNDICVKKNDAQCTNFQSICSQCPPSNYVAIMLQDMFNTMGEMKKRIETNEETSRTLYILCVVLIIMFCIFFLALILENRFKLITKLCECVCKRDGKKYELLKSRKSFDNKRLYGMDRIKENIDEKVDLRLNSMMEMLKNLAFKDPIKFHFEYDSREIELQVKSDDCVVSIKKEICEKLSNGKSYNYKMMKLKYQEKILDDNHFLVPQISSGAVTCFMDQDRDPGQILIVKQSDYTCLPALFQVRKNQSIKELRTIIENPLNCKDFIIINGNEELQDQMIMGEYIKDNHMIRVKRRLRGKLTLNSIFGERQLSIDYFNTDKISSITQKVGQEVKADTKFIYLFHNEHYLAEEKFLFDYGIDDFSNVQFFYPICLNDLELTDELVDSESISDMFWGYYKDIEGKILIKQYKQLIEKLLDDKHFLQLVITCHHLNTQPQFTKTIGIHKTHGILLVAMEYMEGSLTSFLESKISENEIHKWTLQIMKALKCLHDRGITYGGLTPYNILMNKDKNIKLASFTLLKYFLNPDINQIIKLANSNSYVAPEIKRRHPHQRSTDVWSLGMILVHMVNGKPPNVSVDENEGSVSYNLENNVSNDLHGFIDSCIKYEKNERLTIDQLMEHKFIKDHI